MTPILRAEGAGVTLDSPLVILSTLTLLEWSMDIITMLSFIISLGYIRSSTDVFSQHKPLSSSKSFYDQVVFGYIEI